MAYIVLDKSLDLSYCSILDTDTFSVATYPCDYVVQQFKNGTKIVGVSNYSGDVIVAKRNRSLCYFDDKLAFVVKDNVFGSSKREMNKKNFYKSTVEIYYKGTDKPLKSTGIDPIWWSGYERLAPVVRKWYDDLYELMIYYPNGVGTSNFIQYMGDGSVKVVYADELLPKYSVSDEFSVVRTGNSYNISRK